MARERDADKPAQSENAAPFPTLEKLFSTANAAEVVTLESAGNGYRDPRISIDTLADRYAGVFGKSRAPRRRNRDFNFADIDRELQEERAEFAKPGDSYVMEMVRKNEARFMAKVLLSPSKDPEQVRQRQELIGRLAVSEHLDELVDLKDQTWQVFEGLWNFRQMLGNYRWEDTTLIEHYYAGTEFVPILEDEYNRGSEVLEKEDVMEIVGEAVDRINGGLVGFAKFGEALASSGDPYVRQAFSGIPSDIARLQQEMATLIPFDKKPIEKGKHEYPDEKRDELEELVKRIEPYFFSQSAVLEFAKKVREERWQAVSSDAAKPFGYEGGWNIEESKDRQVHNDSPVDAPITILSGANTSGKSFTMKSDFMIRIAAQSIGFAPVQSGNLPQFDSFIFLDRAATDPQNDLSAFMREIENWKLALKDVGAKTRLYVDEGYSTTSPHDQATLLLATAGYIQRRGGSVMLATHNDLLLDVAEQSPHMQVYNLQTEVGNNGDLIRHFKLQPGRSESLSYAVARARQFPQSALAAAYEYLESGRIEPTVALGGNYPAISEKSPEQREQEKQIAATLEQLFPNEPTNPVFHLFSLDNEMKPHGLLWHVSRGRRQDAGGMYESHELLSLLGQMVLWQPSQTPEDILERQRLFEELTKESLYANLPAMTEQIGFLEETVAVVSKHAKDGVNKGLNPFRVSNDEIAEMIKQIDRHTAPHQFGSILKAIDAYLGIQQKLFGELPQVSELRGRFATLAEVNDALLQRWQSYRENPLTDEEQEKVVVAIGKTENPGQAITVQELHKAIVGMFADLREVSHQIPAVGIRDFPVKDLAEELDILETYNRGGEKKDDTDRPKRPGMMWQLGEMLDLMSGGLPLAVQRLPNMLENARMLTQTLKSTDSVYLHQAANLIQAQLAKHEAILAGEAEDAVEEEVEGIMPQDRTSRFNHLDRRSGSLFFGRPEPKATPYKTALKQVEALAVFAGILEQQGFTKVAFNDTGEVHFRNAFSVFKNRDEEIANNIDFSPSDRVQILTGPNGSGKTFYEKGAVAGVLMGLATGYAPAESATMPVFDAVTYLDRVVEKQDTSYSAFSQEIEYWKELLGLLPNKKAVFAVVDEAFSTTSPGYQAAFTSAVVAEVLNSPHFLMLSTHNHDAVTSLTGSGLQPIKPHHFVFDVKDGQIEYQYRLQDGHQTSHALEVARTMGLPEEITSSA